MSDWWNWAYFHISFRIFWKYDPRLYQFLHWIKGSSLYLRRLILRPITTAWLQIDLVLRTQGHLQHHHISERMAPGYIWKSADIVVRAPAWRKGKTNSGLPPQMWPVRVAATRRWDTPVTSTTGFIELLLPSSKQPVKDNEDVVFD